MLRATPIRSWASTARPPTPRRTAITIRSKRRPRRRTCSPSVSGRGRAAEPSDGRSRGQGGSQVRQQPMKPLAAASPGRQRGAVAIMVGLSLVVLVVMLALVMDLGQHHITRTELQNAADAGALDRKSVV